MNQKVKVKTENESSSDSVVKVTVKKQEKPKEIPAHLAAILALKPTETPIEPSEEHIDAKMFYKSKDRLEPDPERSLVAAKWDKQDRLVLEFDDGEKIITKPVPVNQISSSVVVTGDSGGGGEIGVVDFLQFNTSADIAPVSQGMLTWSEDQETLVLGQNAAQHYLGLDLEVHVRNNTASVITRGTPVMAVGTLGNSGRILVAPMDGTNSANYKFLIGVAGTDIAIGADGKILSFGKVRGVNTSAFNDGDVLWVSTTTPGEFTNVEPLTGLKMPVSFVVHAANNGIIMVRITPIDENNIGSAVSSVAGKVGDVLLTKDDVGLSDVDNTSDLDKPISDATQLALNSKQDILTDANFGSFVDSLSDKTTPINTDTIPLTDSADSNKSKKLSWANIKATLNSYFAGIFVPYAGANADVNLGTNTLTAEKIITPISGTNTAIKIGSGNSDTNTVNVRIYSPTINTDAGWKGSMALGNSETSIIMGAISRGGADISAIGGHSAALNSWGNLFINHGGGKVRVGGTNDPVNTLDVTGTFGVSGNADFGNSTSPLTEVNINGLTGAPMLLRYKDGGVSKWDIRKTSNNLLAVYNYDISGFNIYFDPNGSVNLPQLTPSAALALDASKNIVSVTNTGSGNNVLANSPTLLTPNIGAATGSSLSVTGNISAGGYIEATKSSPGSTVAGYITHTNNTDGNSNALFSISSGGANGGDAILELNNQVAGSAVRMTLDNSDSDMFKMQRAGTTFLTSTLAGVVNLPLQPSFMVRRTTNSVSVTGDGTAWTAVFNSEISDIGNVFSGNTTFTAPISSNRYYFNTSLNIFDLTTANSIRLELVTTQYVYPLFFGQAGTNTQQTINGSVMNVVMNAGDTASVRLTVSGGTKIVDVLGEATALIRTYFSGGLM